jgi:two-component system, cell cycle response regulator DivK
VLNSTSMTTNSRENGAEALDEGREVVMVVDDDEATRDVLRDVLTEAGYLVLAAGNGREALDLLRRQPVAVVLTDLVMPEMDGWGLARGMRDDPDVPPTPIVVMTAHGPNVLVTAPVASGYFHKPLGLEPLLQVLERAIARRTSGIRRVTGGLEGEPESER